MNRKESRKIFMSVEGINCERLYFLHLARIINSSNRNTYNLRIEPKVMSPKSYAKGNYYKPRDKWNKKDIPFIHIQDIEDYYDDVHKRKFLGLIDEMREAEHTFSLTYILGYSNYTFELWLLLHVADMNYSVANRYDYLEPINRWFRRSYKNLDEYKAEKEFQSILNDYVTIDSVKDAIRRAETIVDNNKTQAKHIEKYKKVEFFHDNPDTSVHEIVKLIFDICEVN